MPGSITPHPATAPRFIAIGSGKGGVGKTWCAITLSHALARRGRRVLLADADFGLANVDVQLGLAPLHDVADVLAGTVPLAEAVRHHPEGGFDVLPGRSGSGTLANLERERLDPLLMRLQAQGTGYDHVLLDLGAGLDNGTRRMAAWADALFVVATDEPTSLTDAYATLKLHAADRPGGDARVIVNQAASAAAAARTASLLCRACATFLGREPAVLGFVRRDGRVPEAVRHQALLLTRHPTTPAAVDMERLAAGL